MEPLSKVLRLTETSVFDEDSMAIDDILKQIPEDMMLPSILAEEPTQIKFGRGIEIKEVDWYKATIPRINPLWTRGRRPLWRRSRAIRPKKFLL
ncbi:crooked neck-like protein 1 [Dorcoceras hygrometricum]|uniref:Crooked neck-like protein 1 n=1 Tax=Dorcoceras hygrometricum TaxID=472368 RepID=A0A2Z7DAP8_9LAMI|nr:crooked neck-like protein 1 [Dorcoceras hygrometricum]